MAENKKHPSSSHVQAETEEHVRELLHKKTGLTYESRRIDIGDSWVEVDAVGMDNKRQVRELVDI